MKALKFTEAQIASVLKRAADGSPVEEVCRKAGISDATFYNWRKKYAGLLPTEMKRLRQLDARRRTRSSSGSWRTCRWTRPCSRMFSQKSSEACAQAPTGGRCSGRLEGLDATRLRGARH